ncbi:MAG TPA: type IV toxin-antitoxin system AbiEi family antitoxin [Bryobacteraceae bacterium]|jgi:hypothetical protein|nr:type IV toxin-antitoxin system AbiEi family antitoxin [Bryobacteraceae bacterium]
MSLEAPSLAALEEIPFVQELHYAPAAGPDRGYDGELDIRTPIGNFRLPVEIKRSFLTESAVSQFLGWLEYLGKQRPERAILLARYIPRPVADRLIAAKVNFADDAGNIHLALGDQYHWTSIGKSAPATTADRRPVSPAQLQLLFQFVTNPDSITWPVRRLESAAGIGKSSVASLRQQLVEEGLLVRSGKGYGLAPVRLLRERLVSGYVHILRPRLSLGRFRARDKSGELFLGRVQDRVSSDLRYSLTGASAAFILQQFYRSPDIALFVESMYRAAPQALRLLPDREGPITLLQAFGEVVFWQERQHHMLAPPWLIYAELCASADPRAHEAAEELYRKLLV